MNIDGYTMGNSNIEKRLEKCKTFTQNQPAMNTINTTVHFFSAMKCIHLEKININERENMFTVIFSWFLVYLHAAIL